MQRPETSTFLAEVLSDLEDLPEDLARRLEELIASEGEARKATLVDLFEELTSEELTRE